MDLLTRARIDQRLHFDSGVLARALIGANVPIFFEGKKEIPPEGIKAIYSAYDMLEKFLSESEYLVGNDLTIADFSALPSVTTLNLHIPLEAETYPNIIAWIDRLSVIPLYDDLITRVSQEIASLLESKRGSAEE